MKFYYRTAWNASVRCIDLASVDFARVRFQTSPLDKVREQPVEMIKVR